MDGLLSFFPMSDSSDTVWDQCLIHVGHIIKICDQDVAHDLNEVLDLFLHLLEVLLDHLCPNSMSKP